VAIGKTLHENLSQILCAAKLYVELAKTNDDQRAVCLMKSSEYIVDVIGEIRSIYKLLGSPGIILELFESIQALVDGLNSLNPTKIDFQHYAIYEEDLDENLQLDIFRIVQEQLNNVLLYSKASYAIINLTRHSNEATLLISDNGIGCDMHNVKMGAGIINIMTRAESYDGSVVINSKPGEGYELKVTLPLYGQQKELVHQLSDYNDAE
jgi:signal transduction histidine kinase